MITTTRITHFEWLQSICGDKVKSVPWHNSKVLRLEEVILPNRNYHIDYVEESIDPSKIIGIDYGFGYNFYNDITWIELLNKLHRFNEIIEKQRSYESLIEHIMTKRHDQKCVYEFRNEYITFNGQHRMCLAKFLGLPKVDVLIHRYKLIE